MGITANRGGITASQWYETDIPVNLQPNGNRLYLTLQLDSKGGGTTDVQLTVSPDDFVEVMRGMLHVDYQKTVAAFSKALI